MPAIDASPFTHITRSLSANETVPLFSTVELLLYRDIFCFIPWVINKRKRRQFPKLADPGAGARRGHKTKLALRDKIVSPHRETIFTLRRQGFTYKEISKKVKLPPWTVRDWYREQLQKEGLKDGKTKKY